MQRRVPACGPRRRVPATLLPTTPGVKPRDTRPDSAATASRNARRGPGVVPDLTDATDGASACVGPRGTEARPVGRTDPVGAVAAHRQLDARSAMRAFR
jgi:hypothetical protein